MKILLIGLILSASCATKPVRDYEWVSCQLSCEVDEEQGLLEVCHSLFKGLGCTCYDGTTIWLGEGGL